MAIILLSHVLITEMVSHCTWDVADQTRLVGNDHPVSVLQCGGYECVWLSLAFDCWGFKLRPI